MSQVSKRTITIKQEQPAQKKAIEMSVIQVLKETIEEKEE